MVRNPGSANVANPLKKTQRRGEDQPRAQFQAAQREFHLFLIVTKKGHYQKHRDCCADDDGFTPAQKDREHQSRDENAVEAQRGEGEH